MHALECRILQTVRERKLIPPASRGLLCVSGGADSMALLALLHALRDALSVSLDVVHFDHGLRPESAAEAERVARETARLGLPCHIVRAGHLAGLSGGLQAAARAWRRAEAQRLATQWDAGWIATGHQREDHLETLLLKWLRGAHISRLQGMAWRGGPFVRPLLGTGRAELTAYLEARGLAWLEDPSNRDPKYRRNRVRHELLPLLEALSAGGIAARLAALESQSVQVRELLHAVLADHPLPTGDSAAEEPWLDAEALLRLPTLAAGAALHAFVLAAQPGALDVGQVERALRLLRRGGPAWELHLSHGRRLQRRGARLRLLRAGVPARSAAAADGGADSEAGSEADREAVHVLGEWRIRAPEHWAVGLPASPEDGLTLHNLPPRGELLLRRRAVGDRFHPPWRPHPVKLGAFLRDQHVPLHERDTLPLVVLEGQVIAVYPRFIALGFHAPSGGGRAVRLAVRTA